MSSIIADRLRIPWVGGSGAIQVRTIATYKSVEVVYIALRSEILFLLLLSIMPCLPLYNTARV